MLSQLSYAPSHHLPRRRVVLYTTRSHLSTPECDFFSFFSVLGHALRCARQLSHITAALPWRKTQCAQPKVQLRSADSGDLCRHRLGTPAASRPPASRVTAAHIAALSEHSPGHHSAQQSGNPLCVPPPNRRFTSVGATPQMTCRRSRQPPMPPANTGAAKSPEYSCACPIFMRRPLL